jgi:hypothetical protein
MVDKYEELIQEFILARVKGKARRTQQEVYGTSFPDGYWPCRKSFGKKDCTKADSQA